MLRILVFVLLLPVAVNVHAENWPRFRGPKGDGHSDEKNVPVKWDARAITYRVALNGRGQSSPIIWGDKLFLTSADRSGVTRFVTCLNRSNGKTMWEQSVSVSAPVKLHRMNSWATPSCVTDGERVVAFFGEGGIHCFDMDGKKQWSKEVGSFPGNWGNAASPVIINDMVIQNCDATGPSYLIALNKRTGEMVWRSARNDKPRGGWSTPILISAGTRDELVLNGEFGVKGYDPNTGKEYWFCRSFNGRGTPAPAWGHGLLFVVNGKPGDIYAVRPGGSGNVTDQRMAWHTSRRGGRDLPSPILVDDYVFVMSMGGIGSCYEAKSGKSLWSERIGGAFSGSPIAASGLIYIQSESGETVVIRPGPKLDIVARNTLGDRDGEIFRASPGVSDGNLFLRSDQALYCISD